MGLNESKLHFGFVEDLSESPRTLDDDSPSTVKLSESSLSGAERPLRAGDTQTRAYIEFFETVDKKIIEYMEETGRKTRPNECTLSQQKMMKLAKYFWYQPPNVKEINARNENKGKGAEHEDEEGKGQEDKAKINDEDLKAKVAETFFKYLYTHYLWLGVVFSTFLVVDEKILADRFWPFVKKLPSNSTERFRLLIVKLFQNHYNETTRAESKEGNPLAADDGGGGGGKKTTAEQYNNLRNILEHHLFGDEHQLQRQPTTGADKSSDFCEEDCNRDSAECINDTTVHRPIDDITISTTLKDNFPLPTIGGYVVHRDEDSYTGPTFPTIVADLTDDDTDDGKCTDAGLAGGAYVADGYLNKMYQNSK